MQLESFLNHNYVRPLWTLAVTTLQPPTPEWLGDTSSLQHPDKGGEGRTKKRWRWCPSSEVWAKNERQKKKGQGWCIRADTSALQGGTRRVLCYIFLPSYHFTDGWRKGWCDKALSIWVCSIFTAAHYRHRSTTPKWCVGVCSGPVRVWVTSLVHPHRHDTAQNNRLARLPAEAGSSDSVAHPVCIPTVYFVPMWAGESSWWGESHPHSGPVCTVMSAMQHSGVQESVLFMLFVSVPPQAVCLFVRWADYWCRREQKDHFSDYIAHSLEETPLS